MDLDRGVGTVLSKMSQIATLDQFRNEFEVIFEVMVLWGNDSESFFLEVERGLVWGQFEFLRSRYDVRWLISEQEV